MKRIGDTFVTDLNTKVPLEDTRLIEIGCGDGRVTAEFIAFSPRKLVAIDPNESSIQRAHLRKLKGVEFKVANAIDLPFGSGSFDTAVFTLALHEIPIRNMAEAINEAVRVLHPGGNIVFLEPGFDTSFFDAEKKFDACDGDEDFKKHAAIREIKKNKKIRIADEWFDEVRFQFASSIDFRDSLNPKKNQTVIHSFLVEHDFVLTARRRIIVCEVR